MDVVIVAYGVACMQPNLFAGEVKTFFQMRFEVEGFDAFLFYEGVDHVLGPGLIKL